MQRRLTDDERSAVSVVMFWQRKLEEGGITASGQEVYEQMLAHNTTDGLPYTDPPLTDEDARQRILVMVRDREAADWQGPHVFAAKGGHFFYAFVSKGGSVRPWNFARRATPEEIAAVWPGAAE